METKEMEGVLFVNTAKSKDTHPDFRGKCKINDKELVMAGWCRTSAQGNELISLRFEIPQPKTEGDAKPSIMERFHQQVTVPVAEEKERVKMAKEVDEGDDGDVDDFPF